MRPAMRTTSVRTENLLGSGGSPIEAPSPRPPDAGGAVKAKRTCAETVNARRGGQRRPWIDGGHINALACSNARQE